MSEPKTSVRRLEAVQKQAEALRMRRDGKTFEEIAEVLGYETKSGAHKAVISALQKTLQEPADEYRTLQRERLNARRAKLTDLLSKWETKAETGDAVACDRVLKINKQLCDIIKQECELEGLIVHKLDATSNGQTIRPIVVRGEAQGIIPERLVPAREAAEHPSGN